jgi:hypothetical protein
MEMWAADRANGRIGSVAAFEYGEVLQLDRSGQIRLDAFLAQLGAGG